MRRDKESPRGQSNTMVLPDEIGRDYVTQRAVNSILLLSFERIPLKQFLNQTLEIILSLPLVSFLKWGAIFLADRDSGLFTLHAHAGVERTPCRILFQAPLEKLLAGVSGPNAPLPAEPPVQGGKIDPCADENHGRYPIPLAFRGKVFGLLSMQLKPNWSVSASEEKTLAAAANALAVVLERKEAERVSEESDTKLREDSVRLREKSQDLQDFAHVAAHDLREPLRTIESFGDLLVGKSSEDLDDKALDYIGRMRKAAERMETLIDSLLSYSGILTSGQPFSRVNLREVVDEALHNLEVRIRETGGRVSVGVLPSIDADRPQMLQLFQNLIGNALKFHRKNFPPRISIYSDRGKRRTTAQEGFCRVHVEDNGIGMETEYLERIFLPFERLHGKHLYEGSGIGLSICRRIVERHGGSIKAESSPGKGTTFIVALPEKQGETSSCASSVLNH